jgi:hypothetical protein
MWEQTNKFQRRLVAIVGKERKRTRISAASEEEDPGSLLGISATSGEEDPGSMPCISATSEEEGPGSIPVISAMSGEEDQGYIPGFSAISEEEDLGSMPGISASTEEEGGGSGLHTRDLQPVPWSCEERKSGVKKEIWVIDMILVFIQGPNNFK